MPRPRTPLEKLAARIDVHLKRIESDPVTNPPLGGKEGAARPFYKAGSYRGGRFVYVRYVSYQGSHSLTKAEAEAYAAWLDAGNVGTHWRVAAKE
jgi:hypothetical protein